MPDPLRMHLRAGHTTRGHPAVDPSRHRCARIRERVRIREALGYPGPPTSRSPITMAATGAGMDVWPRSHREADGIGRLGASTSWLDRHRYMVGRHAPRSLFFASAARLPESRRPVSWPSVAPSAARTPATAHAGQRRPRRSRRPGLQALLAGRGFDARAIALIARGAWGGGLAVFRLCRPLTWRLIDSSR